MNSTLVDNPTPARPKLVFFRSVRHNLPGYIQLHLRQHVDCLAQFFDVVLLEPDCDFQQVCDVHQPDMVLFESSVYSSQRRIRNLHTNRHIPRAGLFNSDAYCVTRSSFVSDMAEWGVDAFFAISVSVAEYFPSIAENLYTWPNFVDETVYRDYGLSRSIPVLFTGSQATHYPWRNAINRTISQYFPTLNMPHFGWFNAKAASRMLFGEQYARMIASAVVAPTCGTIAKEVVRKHFEIPACGTILVTERTAALESAGFVDLQNCVFAEPGTVIEKLDHLFSDPELCARIGRSGMELVHARHTRRARDQMLQWYQLRKQAQPGTKIVQLSPFGPLVAAPALPEVRNGHVHSGAVDRALLFAGTRLLDEGQVPQAEAQFRACLNYHFMPEPLVGLTRCALRRGAAGEAEASIMSAVSASVERHAAAEADPVEWSYLLATLLVRGDADYLAERAAEFPRLRHALLERARLLVHLLFPAKFPRPQLPAAAVRASVHDPFAPTPDAWIDEVARALDAGGRRELAARVRALRFDEPLEAASANAAAANPAYRRPMKPRKPLPLRAVGFARHQLGTLANRILQKLRPNRGRRSAFADAVLRAWEQENPARTLVLGDPAAADMIRQAAQRSPQPREVTVPGAQPVDSLNSFDAVLVFGADAQVELRTEHVASAACVALAGVHTPSLQILFGALLAAGRHELVYFDPADDGKAILRRAINTRIPQPVSRAPGLEAPAVGAAFSA